MAGVGGGSTDGTNSAARFFYPKGGALDSAGNLYLADSGNHTIRKISPAGLVTTIAGLAGTPGSADGTNSTARFNNPSGVALDAATNIYVADTGNNTIRMISSTGVVVTLAGQAGSYGTADGTNGAARFYHPAGVAIDPAENIYVADTGNHAIRKIRKDPRTNDWIVSSWVGLSGVSGFADGSYSAARFLFPWDVAVDDQGNVFVADAGNSAIRQITPLGEVSTLAGLGGVSGRVDGTGSSARFVYPTGIAIALTGELYVADAGAFNVRRVLQNGVVTTLAGKSGILGNTDALGTNALFDHPCGVVVATNGLVYVTDTGNDTIRVITPVGATSTLAGLALGLSGAAEGAESAARMMYPRGAAVDIAGNVFVADTGNQTIRKVTPAGVVTTLAGLAGQGGSADGTNTGARFSAPVALAVDAAGNLYVADAGTNNTIRKITPAGVVTTLAGLAGTYGSTNGTSNTARFSNPSGVALDGATNVYVADTENDLIRKITPAGVVTTLAGFAGHPGSADGTNAGAQFYRPAGVAVDTAGNVYVADGFSHTIRKVTPAGVVTTLAGLAGSQGGADGTNSAARFTYPHGIAIDSSNSLYVADYGNHTIRMINPAGNVSTLAGFAGSGGGADDKGPFAQTFFPYGVAVDAAGNVYVADTFNSSIRKGTPYHAPVITADPQNQAPIGGDTVFLTVNVTAGGTLTYQWRKNGVAITGATNATLELAGTGAGDAGIYDVVISNAFGSATSGGATLAMVVPANDLFANAITVTGTNFNILASNIGASKEAGEPNHSTNFGGRSVWWKWTAPADGGMILDTGGSSFDTMLAVYSGNSLGTLKQIESDDDNDSVLTSLVNFGAKAGKTYRIAVDGYNGASGNIHLNMTWTPPVPAGITVQPHDHQDMAGADVAFSVAATGSPPLVFQWKHNNTNVPNATDTSILVTNISAADAGTYSVVISNEFGVTTSGNATLALISGFLFNTLSGTPGYGANDGTGSGARFHTPSEVAVDANGNVYVADSVNATVRKITSAGVVTTLAGLAGHPGSADGTNDGARFSYPLGIAVGLSGTVYVSDAGDNNTIRKITSAGVVTTLAGLAGTTGSADGTNGGARFSGPASVAIDLFGNVYVADAGNNTIRKITSAGVVTTWAGQAGPPGYQDGLGTAARFNYPAGLTVDLSGNLYLADAHNNVIRKIDSSQNVTTIAGNPFGTGSADGDATNATFNSPSGIARDLNGNIYVADTFNSTIRLITPAGQVSTLAGLAPLSGSTDGTNIGSRFSFPTGLDVDLNGNVHVADTGNNTIRKVTPTGVVTTFAGSAGAGIADGAGADARFDFPAGAAVDANGNIYVGDYRTLAGLPRYNGVANGTNTDARFYGPSGVALDAAGNLYVADTLNHTIRKVSPAGVVGTYAGRAGIAGSIDGLSTDALFAFPRDVAVDALTNVYVADSGNSTIRKITPAGVVTTYVGRTGVYGHDDGTNDYALFSDPWAVSIDATGFLYVADHNNHTIRKVSPLGVVTTLAGKPLEYGSSGGTTGSNGTARFLLPTGVKVDSSGNVYVTDRGNSTIRIITPAGRVGTVGGVTAHFAWSDGTGAAAQFFTPQAVAVDLAGSIYVADAGNYAIRLGRDPASIGPPLQIMISGNHIVLMWPAAAGGYTLETSGGASGGGSWGPLTNYTVSTDGSNSVVTNVIGPQPAFFRLRK
jgi:hypothetical protein